MIVCRNLDWKNQSPPVPGQYREWTEPIWGMIQVGLGHVLGTVLRRFQDCSGPDQVLFWTRTRNVLSTIEKCSEHDCGMFWAWLRNVLSMIQEYSEPARRRSGAGLGMIWVRTKTGPRLKQYWFRTCLGPTGTNKRPNSLWYVSAGVIILCSGFLCSEFILAKTMTCKLTDLKLTLSLGKLVTS